MSAQPTASDLILPAAPTDADGADTGESRGNVAFCVALWLLGERFGAQATGGEDDGRLKSGSLYNRFDAALGPAFCDEAAPVDLNLCYEANAGAAPARAGAALTRRGVKAAVHPWDAYRKGPLDGYFAALTQRLDAAEREALVRGLGGIVPGNAGFGGMEGFPFHGIKDSALSGEASYDLKKLSVDNLLSGIGPHGELLLRFRRVGDMGFETGSAYQKRWPFKWTGTKSRPHPNEPQLWKNKMKESYFDADLDDKCRGLYGQEVRRTKPDRLLDYLVCAPFVAAWELAEGAADDAQAARRLKRAFLDARQDGAHDAFSAAQRALLDALPWPEDPFGAAAAIGAALVRFALGEGCLADAVRGLLAAELASQSVYLERLRDWALQITERDGASTRADRLQDVYVAPPFSGDDPVSWLLDDRAPRGLLLQAGSGMGKSTFLRALAAACAEARSELIGRLVDGTGASGNPNAPEDDGTRFAAAVAGAADESGAEDAAWRVARLAAYTPVLLSQTRTPELYDRLTGADGLPPWSFEDFAFAALPPLSQDTVRQAAARSEDGAPLPGNPLNQLLEREGVLLMVDSIDEIPRRYRPLYLRRLKEFADQAGVARLLVASRPLPPDDTEALHGLMGPDAARARLAPFDPARQRSLFERVTSRGGADAYAGPTFSQVRAVAGLRDVMGNPFMLTACALELKRSRNAASRGAWWLFSQINDRFRKRATLDPLDRFALERLAFDLTVGKSALPSAEFIERFRRYRSEEGAYQAGGGGGTGADLDEDEVCDLIMSRLGIIDMRAGEVGFPYAAMKGFWAGLWVRRCVERGQSMSKSAMDMEGLDDARQQTCFERGAAAGARMCRQLLGACGRPVEEDDGENGAPQPEVAPGTADDARARTALRAPSDDAALLALMFALDYAGSRTHPDYPAFDLLCSQTYRELLTQCLLGGADEARAAACALRTAAAFGFGQPLAGYAEQAAPYLPRLSAFSEG